MSIEDALPLARALSANGLPVLEITLRTACALEAIALIARELPEACVGAGTVLTRKDLDAVTQAGARFAISPGATDALYRDASDAAIPLIPGIATASELMRGLEHGWQRFKFFPRASGGIAVARTPRPFAQVRFDTPRHRCGQGNGVPGASHVACEESWMVPSDASGTQWHAGDSPASPLRSLSRCSSATVLARHKPTTQKKTIFPSAFLHWARRDRTPTQVRTGAHPTELGRSGIVRNRWGFRQLP